MIGAAFLGSLAGSGLWLILLLLFSAYYTYIALIEGAAFLVYHFQNRRHPIPVFGILIIILLTTALFLVGKPD